MSTHSTTPSEPTETSGAAAPSIASATTMGAVDLTVSDLGRSRAFYEGTIGLSGSDRDDGGLDLRAPGGPVLVRLHANPAAAPLDRRATGLYHLAVLLPTRRDLAWALLRLAQARWQLDGASDHLVSEALYLSDPDGNGIEIYRDRPRHQWPYDGGALQMATLPLDLQDVVSEVGEDRALPAAVPAETVIGHVHLQVASIPDAERFYHGILGFDVTTRGYPNALFVSAGGYHHHIGLNTWHSAGSAPAAPGAVGLRAYEVLLPDRAAVDAVVDRVRAAGLALEPVARNGAAAVRDPSGNLVVLRTP